MANTLTTLNVFVQKTVIASSEVNSNFSLLKDRTPLWQAYSITAAALAALGDTLTAQLALFSLTANEVIDSVIVKHGTVFSGTGITGGDVRVGTTADDAALAPDLDVVAQTVSADAYLAVSNLVPCFSNTTIYLRASLTGGNLSAVSGGGMTVYVRRAELP